MNDLSDICRITREYHEDYGKEHYDRGTWRGKSCAATWHGVPESPTVHAQIQSLIEKLPYGLLVARASLKRI